MSNWIAYFEGDKPKDEHTSLICERMLYLDSFQVNYQTADLKGFYILEKFQTLKMKEVDTMSKNWDWKCEFE